MTIEERVQDLERIVVEGMAGKVLIRIGIPVYLCSVLDLNWWVLAGIWGSGMFVNLLVAHAKSENAKERTRNSLQRTPPWGSMPSAQARPPTRGNLVARQRHPLWQAGLPASRGWWALLLGALSL